MIVSLSSFVAFILSAIAVFIVIKIDKKLKVGQPVLSYVDKHISKSGTPTFGGIGIVFSTIVCVLLFTRGSKSLALMCLAITFAYGVVGFTDDFIKTKSNNNQGLSAKQKIIFQALISIIISIFAYKWVGTTLIIPFSLQVLDLGYFIIPYYIFVFLAFTNAVNLIDGLDGLAGKTSTAYLVFFALIIYFVSGINGAEEENNLILFCVILASSLLGFLLFNSYPAHIFMGDTGSLALGGAIGSLAVMSKLSLYAPIIGFVYVITCISDVIQVAYYKKTKKRIFKMAPLHHHFEKQGVHENKIVSAYTLTTIYLGIICVGLTLFFNH